VTKLNIRVDDALHERLARRAHGANLSLSAFIRSVLEQAADPGRRYVFSSQDEILATCIQIFTILATSIGRRSPEMLEKGMAEAQNLLRERGLLGPEQRS
jgi:RHH-type transcriptional regulator, rel operon repressor / antitoxin RelB